MRVCPRGGDSFRIMCAVLVSSSLFVPLTAGRWAHRAGPQHAIPSPQYNTGPPDNTGPPAPNSHAQRHEWRQGAEASTVTLRAITPPALSDRGYRFPPAVWQYGRSSPISWASCYLIIPRRIGTRVALRRQSSLTTSRVKASLSLADTSGWMCDFNTGVTPPEMIKKRPAATPWGRSRRRDSTA